MTSTAKEHEHIRAAVELVAAKARKQLDRLSARTGVTQAELDEFQRIERMASAAWRALSEREHDSPAAG
jgi:hypothetical protein